MNEQVIKYYSHEFYKCTDKNRLHTWKCKRCGHESVFIPGLSRGGHKILTCNERLIKNIIE